MLSIKDININNFFLLAFFGLSFRINYGLIDLLRRDVVECLFDNLVHVEDTNVFLTSVLLNQHVGNRLLAREGTTQDD